jgi:hypothetical protein
MLLIITGVGFLIHLYSIGYMQDDAGFGKFFAYLNLFVFFMLLLVMGSNYLSCLSAGKALVYAPTCLSVSGIPTPTMPTPQRKHLL